MGEAADDRDRDSGELSFGQFGGGGDFVDQGGDGGVEGVAVGVGLAAVVFEGADSGRADRQVGQAVTPGPPEGVGDDHADIGAQALADARPDPPG
ncbi:hypothetical protein Aple_063160 [Acrocarpospora pleiomorpha]|uniref:Uncharacterized protein n=1 Tax=Acrocarpospora pleiomorpha TaxID=90975 RepID=A0A5M3XPZ8_9ACTN|nr:hypothetical protein Aple_063160 [Acrocarpospora pleiomorpha]